MRDRASSIQSAPGVMRFKTQPHLNQQYLTSEVKNNNFAVSNTSLSTMNDLKNNNLAEHAMLSKSTSNPIDQHHHQFAHPKSNYEVDGRTGSNGTVIAINSNSSFEPNVEIIQPPKQFQQAEKPVHKTRIEITASSHDESTSTSNNTHNTSNRSHSLSLSNVLETSQSSTFTNQTATTTDSGVIVEPKEKKKRRWVFFGGHSNNKSHANDKQKSATLGREKDKDKSKASKSKTIARDEQTNLKHRWSTGLPKLQPLAATISKEKLVCFQWFQLQIRSNKLNHN